LGGSGDASCDFYSLGAIMTAALAGFPPDTVNLLGSERLARAPAGFHALLEDLRQTDGPREPIGAEEMIRRVRALKEEATRSLGELAVPARADLPLVSRRNYRRLPVDLAVRMAPLAEEARDQVGAAVSRLHDVGENGVFVASARPWPPGSVMELDFTLPGGEAIHTLGVVRWVGLPPQEPGMGVQFIEVAMGQRLSLADYVAGRVSGEVAQALTATPARLTLLEQLPELWGERRPVAELADWLGLADVPGGETPDRVLAAFEEFGLVRVRPASGGPVAEFVLPTSAAFATALARLGGWTDRMLEEAGGLAELRAAAQGADGAPGAAAPPPAAGQAITDRLRSMDAPEPVPAPS